MKGLQMLPCIDCLLIPLCKNKMFKKLFNDCSLVVSFIYESSNPEEIGVSKSREYMDDNLIEIYNFMKPTKWKAYKTDAGTLSLTRKISARCTRQTFGTRIFEP